MAIPTVSRASLPGIWGWDGSGFVIFDLIRTPRLDAPLGSNVAVFSADLLRNYCLLSQGAPAELYAAARASALRFAVWQQRCLSLRAGAGAVCGLEVANLGSRSFTTKSVFEHWKFWTLCSADIFGFMETLTSGCSGSGFKHCSPWDHSEF